MVAAVLPIVLVATMSEDLRLRSYANQAPELRIWTSPENVVARVGSEFKIKIYGMTNSPEVLIPKVNLSIVIPEGLDTDLQDLKYERAFAGQTLLGEVEVKVSKDGEYTIEIPEGSVDTQLPSLEVITHGTRIISKR